METQVFIISFIVSFLGSIPPGTINITTMQYAVQGQMRAAFYFALAASITEFFYAGLTVRFQLFLSGTQIFETYFQLITGLGMVALGVVNLLAKSPKVENKEIVAVSSAVVGLKKGIVLGIMNPLTIPFWLAITAYLQGNKLITLVGPSFWIYLIGIATGTFSLLLTIRYLGTKFQQIAENHFIVHQIPGLSFILLGLWNLLDLLF